MLDNGYMDVVQHLLKYSDIINGPLYFDLKTSKYLRISQR